MVDLMAPERSLKCATLGVTLAAQYAQGAEIISLSPKTLEEKGTDESTHGAPCAAKD